MSQSDKNGLMYFIVGLIIALVSWGSQLIGLTINIWFGGVVLGIAFALVVYAFWIWERTSNWQVLLRIGTLAIAAVLYCLLVGKQMVVEWRREHLTVAVKSPEPALQPRAASPSQSEPAKSAVLPMVALKQAGAASSKQRPTVVQVTPSYGNLRQRCLDLSEEIAHLVRHRNEQFQNQALYPQPLTKERAMEWGRSNDAEFRNMFLDQVEEIHNELAELHIRDRELDQILDMDQRNERFRQLPREDPANAFGWMSIFDIQRIGERLQFLASQVAQ